eukprot:COSAG01_NODE_4811_length_4725_cov_29.418720_2_plen_479_part_00
MEVRIYFWKSESVFGSQIARIGPAYSVSRICRIYFFFEVPKNRVARFSFDSQIIFLCKSESVPGCWTAGLLRGGCAFTPLTEHLMVIMNLPPEGVKLLKNYKHKRQPPNLVPCKGEAGKEEVMKRLTKARGGTFCELIESTDTICRLFLDLDSKGHESEEKAQEKEEEVIEWLYTVLHKKLYPDDQDYTYDDEQWENRLAVRKTAVRYDTEKECWKASVGVVVWGIKMRWGDQYRYLVDLLGEDDTAVQEGWIDESIYTDNRCIRMLNNHKPGEAKEHISTPVTNLHTNRYQNSPSKVSPKNGGRRSKLLLAIVVRGRTARKPQIRLRVVLLAAEIKAHTDIAPAPWRRPEVSPVREDIAPTPETFHSTAPAVARNDSVLSADGLRQNGRQLPQRRQRRVQGLGSSRSGATRCGGGGIGGTPAKGGAGASSHDLYCGIVQQILLVNTQRAAAAVTAPVRDAARRKAHPCAPLLRCPGG